MNTIYNNLYSGLILILMVSLSSCSDDDTPSPDDDIDPGGPVWRIEQFTAVISTVGPFVAGQSAGDSVSNSVNYLTHSREASPANPSECADLRRDDYFVFRSNSYQVMANATVCELSTLPPSFENEILEEGALSISADSSVFSFSEFLLLDNMLVYSIWQSELQLDFNPLSQPYIFEVVSQNDTSLHLRSFYQETGRSRTTFRDVEYYQDITLKLNLEER